MVEYLVSFIVSILFTYIASRHKSFKFAHILAVIIPILLVTFRDEKVGTDTFAYIDIFKSSSEFDSLFDFWAFSRIEIGFSTLVYIIEKSGLSLQWFYFICSFITVVPIYIGCQEMKDKISPAYSMALYYLMFYHYSFNIVRQSMAMSLIFFATVWLLKGEKKYAIVTGICALGFHNIASLFALPYFAFIYKDLTRSAKLKMLLFSIIVFFVAVHLILVYLGSTIDYYSTTYFQQGKSEMQMSYFVEMTINFFIVYTAWRRNKQQFEFFVFVAGIVLFSIATSTIGPFFFRVANCLDILLLVYIPLAFRSLSNIGKQLYLGFAMFYWLFVFVYNNSGETIPYVSVLNHL